MEVVLYWLTAMNFCIFLATSMTSFSRVIGRRFAVKSTMEIYGA